MVDEVKAIYRQMIGFNFEIMPITTDDHYMNRVVYRYDISLLDVSAGREFSQEVLKNMVRDKRLMG